MCTMTLNEKDQAVKNVFVFVLWLLFLIAFTNTAKAQESAPDDSSGTDKAVSTEKSEGNSNLLDMSLEELLNVEIAGTSLTQTSRRKTPSTVTSISKEDIQRSGARSLYELFDVYVPNFEWIFHPAKLRHMGLRGVISGRDDKYLLLVNGRVMNDQTDYGVVTERAMPMLKDIHHIDVIRGPGSALYGPGALAMVINIVTDNSDTFQGMELTNRVGSIEEFYSSEFKYGQKFKDDSGLFLYGGTALYPGASADHSPVVFGAPTIKYTGSQYANGTSYTSTERATDNINPFNGAYGNRPHVKLHAEYKKDGHDYAFRYTQGSEYIDLTNQKENHLDFAQTYRQAMVYWKYDQEVSSNLSMNYMLSFDRFETTTHPYFSVARNLNYREDEYFAKVIANWKINDNHKLAFGGSASHVRFGNPPTFSSDDAVEYRITTGTMPKWSTNMFSLLGEYQWTMSDQWTMFISSRMDDHSRTDNMFSPKLSLIYTPSEKDTIKLIASRSARTNTASEMKKDDISGLSNSDFETQDAFELRYERQTNENLWLAAGMFYQDTDVIGWGKPDPALPGQTMNLGNQKVSGFELEATYVKDKVTFNLSHGFTKLLDFKMVPGITIEDTAAPMGFGNDLANWFNNITKARIHYAATDKLSLDSSLVIYWDNPGGQDYANYINSITNATNIYDTDAKEAFDTSYHLNFGAEYKYSKNLTFRCDMYDIIGWFDTDATKRRYGFEKPRPGAYRSQPPSIAFQMVYKF